MYVYIGRRQSDWTVACSAPSVPDEPESARTLVAVNLARQPHAAPSRNECIGSFYQLAAVKRLDCRMQRPLENGSI